MTTRPVKAGWALAGKAPGASDDYKVLACSSSPFGRADYAAILARFTAGTPSTRDGGAASLPWVTISWVGTGADLHLGIAIQDDSGDADAMGRPIVQTSYFCLPYAELRDFHVSYVDLHRAVSAVRLPAATSEPVELELPPLDPQTLARTVGELGEEAVASAAAELLNGPANIVHAEGTSLEQRLSYLDAVAAMLPHGYRASYTASTWSESGPRLRIRLAFAARARDNVTPISWQNGVVPSGEAAAAYLAQLDQLRGRAPGRPQTFELPYLIGYLANDVEPRKFEQPQSAIDRLRDIDLPSVVFLAVQSGTAEPADVRRVFAQSRVGELDAEGQQALLATLICYGEREDWPTVQQWWDRVAGDSVASPLQALTSTGRRLLWAATPNPLVRDYLQLAAARDLDDVLLEALMRPPRKPADLAGGADTAAQLLKDAVIARGTADRHPRTRAAVAHNPLVVAGLMEMLADSPADAALAQSWLTQVVAAEVIWPFATVLTSEAGAVDQRAIARLADCELGCVRALLQAASNAHRLDRVLRGFVFWLAARGEMSHSERRYWYDAVWALRPREVSSSVWIDLALLAVGEAPRSLLALAGERGWPEFSDSFTAAWVSLSGRVRADQDRVTSALTTYLDQQAPVWTAKPSTASSVVDITERLTQQAGRPGLLAVVASALAAVPAAAEWAFARDWLAQVEQRQPGIVKNGALLSLRIMPPGITPEQIAPRCVRAFQDKVTPSETWDAMVESGAVRSGIFAVRLLEEVRRQLVVSEADPEAVVEWVVALARMIASGELGKPAAKEFCTEAARYAADEMWHQFDLMCIAALRGGDARPSLSDEVRQSLETLHGRVDWLLKKTRKPPWRTRPATDNQEPREDRQRQEAQ